MKMKINFKQSIEMCGTLNEWTSQIYPKYTQVEKVIYVIWTYTRKFFPSLDQKKRTKIKLQTFLLVNRMIKWYTVFRPNFACHEKIYRLMHHSLAYLMNFRWFFCKVYFWGNASSILRLTIEILFCSISNRSNAHQSLCEKSRKSQNKDKLFSTKNAKFLHSILVKLFTFVHCYLHEIIRFTSIDICSFPYRTKFILWHHFDSIPLVFLS